MRVVDDAGGTVADTAPQDEAGTSIGTASRDVGEMSREEQALALFIELGTLTAVSREMGIPYHEMQKLSRTMWWNDEVARLRKDQASTEIAMQSQVLEVGLAHLLDRIQNGDKMTTKRGSVRVPLKATDIARIVHTVFTERQLLRNEPTAIAGETGKVQVLADKLRALGAKDITIIEEDGHATEAS